MDDIEFNQEQRRAEVNALVRIAELLELIVDEERGCIRMVDIDRAKVYKTHLGGKLSGE